MTTFKTLLLSGVAIWLLNGCNTANIDYNGQQLVMQVNNTTLQMDGRLMAKKNLNFRTLFLSQKVLQTKEGNFIVYEDAQTDINYEFQFSLIYITRVVFDAGRIRLLYSSPKMQIFQLQLPNGKILNVLAQQSQSQEIKYMYGMSAKQLDHILKTLQAKVLYKPYRDVLQLRNTFNAIRSRWTERKIDFVPLVVPYQTSTIY
ncbi:hypothetical protein [Sulfurovum sp. NBC37-1]|uniref:hypothetical protein n=1 Tax=Sulfurovum sp. (strain NBC37-1) TaxID=387093 RepID=UPI00015877B4|nr:hypothetical protein [Sulfurovum sp. NBC37-1]BAF71630.1 hypothetical protein SUN_0671 [Sulfurovum sp. NBC37-1]